MAKDFRDLPCNLYLLSESDLGPTKVGICSGKPNSRLGELQCGNPRRLSVYRSFCIEERPLARKLEKFILKHFSAFRMNGEWIALSPGIISDLIEKLVRGGKK